MNIPLVVIVIPTFNRKYLLRKLVTQLFNQVFNNDLNLEIIVVVDGSTDGTIEMLKNEFPKVYVVRGTGNWWFTKSLNEGIKVAEKLQPDFILTLNDDVEIKKDYIKTLINAYLSINKLCILGSLSLTNEEEPRILSAGIRDIIFWRYKLIPYYHSFEKIPVNELKGVHKSRLLITRGMLIPTIILNEFNYFDEKFIQYGSDDDFSLRVAKKYPLYISWDAKIFCHHNKTGKGTTYMAKSYLSIIINMFNKYSKSSLKKKILFFYRHGNKFLLPITLFISILAEFYSYRNYRILKIHK